MKIIVFLFVLFVFTISGAAQEKYTIQQYLNIKSASSPSFSADGKRLIYLTNVSGTSQVWAIDLPNGQPKQLTKYDDNVSFARFSPAGDEIVFGKAIGGNENTQFYLMKADGGNVRELTANPQVRHNFGDWSADGKTIYYASNKRDRNFFDVYRMEVSSGKEEILYQQNGSNNFAAASDDGSKIIISRSGTELSLDNNLYLIDVKTRKETLLTPHEGAAQFGDVEFLSNDEIVFGTNDKREFINLARMNLKDNKMQFLDQTDWDLDAGALSEDKKTMAYTINREGFSELNVVETKNIGVKTEPVKLPAQGIVSGLEFSRDGKKLAFSFGSAKYNSDAWLYDLEKKTLTQITKSDRAGIPQESFVAPELIKYKTFDGRVIPAWYYVPASVGGVKVVDKRPGNESVKYLLSKSDSLTATRNADGQFFEFTEDGNIRGGLMSVSAIRRRSPKPIVEHAVPTNESSSSSKFLESITVPVIISVHGGPEAQERPGFNPLYQYYLSRGYAVLATNVRGSTGYGKTFASLDNVRLREDSVKDLAYAVEWLKTSGGADAKRIAVTGGSYGGYMTMAAITLYPDLFAAAVNTVGIVNWETFLTNTSGYRRRQREVEYGMLDKDIDFLRKISPIAKVDKIKTPLFVIHGKNDPRVPYTEAEQVVKALKDRGAIVEYKLYDDEGHGISKLKNRLDLFPRVADFLDKYMK